VAIIDLRVRTALKPDLPPEPPLHDDGGSAFGMVGRLGGHVTMAAIAACGFVWNFDAAASEQRICARGLRKAGGR
jgi:hypothetical protein